MTEKTEIGREKDRVRARAWAAANRERAKEKSRVWRAGNPERHRANNKTWRLANPERLRERERNRRYGLKPGEWDALFIAQGSKCAICSTDTHGGRHWHTDHDHATERVRGIVCHNCNHMLGGAKDNIKTLEAGIAYLVTYAGV